MRVNDVELCVDTFGERGDPPLLLVMGSNASMDWWEDGLCERLAGGGRFVVRYDQRDTGGSVSYPAGAPDYTGADLVADALGVLDALGLASAHLVGMSSGGALAQIVALGDPERVDTLTLISTTKVVGDTPAFGSVSPVEAPDWSDRQAVTDYMVELSRGTASPERHFDEEAFREFAGRVLDRTSDIEASMRNHDLLEQAEPPEGRLEDLSVPTLVIHGRDDPWFPLPHGEALARAIPGARLLVLDATGHELPRERWDEVVPAILELTAQA